MSTETKAITIDRLAGAYVKLRDKRSEIKAAYEAEDKLLKDKMDVLKRSMLKTCTDLNADSIRTAHGTVIRGVKTRYWTSDWDKMHAFIMEHNLPQLLENRIAQKNMKQFLEENPDEMPEGLNKDNEYDITVRRS